MSTYLPQTEGHIEVVNCCSEPYQCFAFEQLAYWLPWAELWYNTTIHAFTATTPFKVIYGRALLLLVL